MKVLIGDTNVSGKYKPEELDKVTIMLSAFDGEVGQGTLPQPDPTEVNEWYSGQSCEVTSDDDATTIVDGFIGEQMRDRGERAKGRVDSLTLWDDNALLYGFRAHNWSRSSETDRARVLAFASAYLPSEVTTTWVLDTNTATLPAKKYDTADLFAELLQDVKDATGKTIYIENRNLHSHLISEGQTPSFAISDSAWDYSGTWPPSPGATRDKDPAELKNDVLAVNSAGKTGTASDSDSITRYNAGGLKHEDIVDFPDAAAADLDDLAAAAVAATKDERITYTISCGPFTDAQTALVVPGGLISVTCGEVGLSASTQRIANVRWTWKVNADGKSWWAQLELGFPLRIRNHVRVLPPPILQVPSVPATTDTTIADNCSGTPTFTDEGRDDSITTYPEIHSEVGVSAGLGASLDDSRGLGTNGCDIGATRWWGTGVNFDIFKSNTICRPDDAVYLRAVFSAVMCEDNGTGSFTGRDFGVYCYLWRNMAPTSVDGGILLGTFYSGTMTIDIPAYFIGQSEFIELLFAPILRDSALGQACIVNTQTPIGAKMGNCFGYTLSSTSLLWKGLDTGQSATANWLPVEELPDGLTSTFTLFGWDGTGSPEVTVNGLPAVVASQSASAGTVTLAAAPPANAVVLARYPVRT